ncbi:ATP-binding protein [Flavobacterium sp. HSC-61S13]|uniref:hybrid sensor histidine kinase/response regulator n=1 Tax=Flavobacterium sp. HSC-61S13 TaxID=2910963 RepID=UPI00209F3B10|nr:ATP-binding protein [Flavobacterium sp. HSC-61S13]MCP1995581.1 signal transduction histidine kinase/ActR/RegA family two-component response regulator [Flavobacterium sp. HSC-61S13]
MKNPKSIKFKILIVYIVLFGAALFCGAYIFRQMKLITLPEQSVIEESNKIFMISSAINNLYSSEASSRSAILTGKTSEIKKYHQQLDSVNHQIELIKLDVETPELIFKLDTIQQLLHKKKSSFDEIVVFRKKMNSSENYDSAINQIHQAKEQIEKDSKPVVHTTEKQKRSLWGRMVKAWKAESDTIKTTINQPGLTDSLALAVERIFEEAAKKETKVQQELLKKEHSLLQENKNLTDQLRYILESVEHNILTASYQKISDSRTLIGNATTNIAWIGTSALITVVLLGWIILNDLNQTQRYRKELEKLNAEKEVLLRSKTMLLATVTHDIQTPLGSVLGFTELLSKTDLNDKQQTYIKNIRYSSQYIVNLVNDLIDFSKLENNKISIEKKIFNFKELIESTCLPLQQNAINKNIELKWTAEESLNQNYISDPYRIKQALTNLITNAIKFTQEGMVSIAVTRQDEWIEIKVSDSGIGIAPDQLDNIFKEFKQAHAGIEKKFGGTGLGLNISKRIAELLYGNISVSSELGKGSTFTLRLPIMISNKKATDLEDEISIDDLSVLKDKRILIIDDDALQLQLMKEVFEPLVQEVTLLNDASLIIEVLEQSAYDVILTDIQMPKVDGFELISLLQNHAVFASIPIIALSGKRDLSIEDFIELGFTNAHPKPIQITVLLKMIQSLWEQPSNPIAVKPTTLYANDIQQDYNLSGLRPFLQDDAAAMRNILQIFVDSTAENIKEMYEAAAKKDEEILSDIAHKMLPMFRQLDIISVIPLLEPMEDYQLDYITAADLETYIKHLEQTIEKVFEVLKKIELY